LKQFKQTTNIIYVFLPGRKGCCGKSRTGLRKKEEEKATTRKEFTHIKNASKMTDDLTAAAASGVNPRTIISGSIEVVSTLGVSVRSTSGGVQGGCENKY
jgi:hypothetical protein